MTTQSKRCVTCAKVKDFSEYSRNVRTQDGRRDECTECRNIKRRLIKAADYDGLLAAQGGKCAICKIDADIYGRRFAVDHDHEYNDAPIRGLLCHYCNTIIGMADESPHILQAAIGYLKVHEVKVI